MSARWKGGTIDLIVDGVPGYDLAREGDRAVWRALVRTAASAMQRDVTEPEWTAELNKARSTLGRQARLPRSRKERTEVQYGKMLHNAWTAAAKWLTEKAEPAISRDQVLTHITAVENFIADADGALTENQHAVLQYAVTVARKHSTTRPALPRLATAEATGLTERTTRTTIASLVTAGLLVLDVRGWGGKTEAKARWRANLYRLPDEVAISTYLSRETRPVGHLGTDLWDTRQFRPLDAGTDLWDTQTGGHPMEQITVTRRPDGTLAVAGPSDVLERAVAALRAEGVPISVIPDHVDQNVVPLHRTGRESA